MKQNIQNKPWCCHLSTLDNEDDSNTITFQGNLSSLHDSFVISQQLSDLLTIKQPFSLELEAIIKPSAIKCKQYTYFGEVNRQNIPNGWGKKICSSGQVIIGQFLKGKINGSFFWGKSNGNYQQGKITNGKLNQQGIYYSHNFKYMGKFKENLFHGKGQIFQENYSLSGQFFQGKLSSGKLVWMNTEEGTQYQYTGDLNENFQMHGKGVLIEPFGQYSGYFKNNKKHGKGKYVFNNLNKFVGNYENNYKQGYGQLSSKYHQILYTGLWKEGNPVEEDFKDQSEYSDLNIKIS